MFKGNFKEGLILGLLDCIGKKSGQKLNLKNIEQLGVNLKNNFLMLSFLKLERFLENKEVWKPCLILRLQIFNVKKLTVLFKKSSKMLLNV